VPRGRFTTVPVGGCEDGPVRRPGDRRTVGPSRRQCSSSTRWCAACVREIGVSPATEMSAVLHGPTMQPPCGVVLPAGATFDSPARGRSFVSGRWRHRSRCLRCGIVESTDVGLVPVSLRRPRDAPAAVSERMPRTSQRASMRGPGPRGSGESVGERGDRPGPPARISRAAGHAGPSGPAGFPASLEPASTGTEVYRAPGHVRDRGDGRPDRDRWWVTTVETGRLVPDHPVGTTPGGAGGPKGLAGCVRGANL
jgi:hypothetical protein